MGISLKKLTWFLPQDPLDERILLKLKMPYILDQSYLDKFNVVTDWFDDDPGWKTDKSVEPENPYSPIP